MGATTTRSSLPVCMCVYIYTHTHVLIYTSVLLYIVRKWNRCHNN